MNALNKDIVKGLRIAFGVILLMIMGFSQLFFGSLFPIKIVNFELIKFKAEFEQIPLPENTEKVGRIYSEFGLIGNGNHCDYHVGMLVKSDLTLKELDDYYSKYSLQPADPNETLAYTYGEKKRGHKPVPIGVVHYSHKEEFSYKGEIEKQFKINTPSQDEKNKLFFVEAYDQGYEARYINCT